MVGDGNIALTSQPPQLNLLETCFLDIVHLERHNVGGVGRLNGAGSGYEARGQQRCQRHIRTPDPVEVCLG